MYITVMKKLLCESYLQYKDDQMLHDHIFSLF